MRISDLFLTASRGVTVNIKRSMLTTLGIIVGVASVVLMSAVGESMKGVILGQISSLGAKSMVIFPGQEEGGPQAVATGHDSLTFEDLEQLRKLRSITSLAPVIFVSGKTVYGREEGSPQILGVTTEFFANQNLEIVSGRGFDRSDVDGSKFNALAAPDVVTKFFGSEDPVGKRIKIGNNFFTVVGTTKALGSQFFQNADNRIYVPYTVARTVTAQKYLNYVTMLATGNFDVAFDEVKSLLRYRHGIDNPAEDPEKDDFIVHSSEEASDILGGVSLGLTFFITAVAAISLVVGGIGIMNIMLVSVTERTQEIGLRKALGARGRDILFQFLIEAVILTAIGGLIGMGIGTGIAYFAAGYVHGLLSTYVFAVSLPSMIASLLMASLTGLIFGISPARRAAALSPMEALRYE